ncbi:F0F1 ATP synthase subunit delta [Leucobacter sp. M11]|uniref:F0F1 ATP synthase subunit delta n=1 Tax=Leucobacter sp. M11 TaxID=2993565 RepID=UPI002D7E8E64|nr:F0F1 ATP synthase subunit delta [Leucobacter sp. M11]MEB4615638.1 F0F1 ATP synthase subunit delta [Leucobacter sp. M11]
MGSASREALAQSTKALAALGAQATAQVGTELLNASAVIADAPGLRAAIVDPAVEAEPKRALIGKLFGGFTPATQQLLAGVAQARWSNADELVTGIEELGIRAEAHAAGSDSLDDELLAVNVLIGGNHELELTLGSKLGDADAKVALAERVFGSKISEPAARIVAHIVRNARGRRIGALLTNAAELVADQAGKSLATVTVSAPLDAARQERLSATLSATVGRPVKLTFVVDPALLGGMHVRIGDNVIDGSVSARLNDLRQQLAS